MKAMMFMMLMGCVTDYTTVEQQLCTIEDQDAGLCDGPFDVLQASLAAAESQGTTLIDPDARVSGGGVCTRFSDHATCDVRWYWNDRFWNVSCTTWQDRTQSCIRN